VNTPSPHRLCRLLLLLLRRRRRRCTLLLRLPPGARLLGQL